MSTIAKRPSVSYKLVLLVGLGFFGIKAGSTLAQDLAKSSNCVVRGNGVTDASPGGAKPITRIRKKMMAGGVRQCFGPSYHHQNGCRRTSILSLVRPRMVTLF